MISKSSTAISFRSLNERTPLKWRVASVPKAQSSALKAPVIDAKNSLTALILDAGCSATALRRICEKMLDLNAGLSVQAVDNIQRLQQIGAEASHLLYALRSMPRTSE